MASDLDRPGDRWWLLRSGPGAAAENMAMDEALLESMPRLGRPVLRFYGWTEPAASFGYFQHYEEVERLTALRPLVRRPTGGGLVPHQADWTYSLAFPNFHPWYSLAARESYRRVHQWLVEAFELTNIATRLAPSRHVAAPGQCFGGYEPFDVLWRGQKIAGAAQRRTRDGLLIQGSVQPGTLDFSRAEWEQSFCAAAPQVDWDLLELDGLLKGRVAELVQLKYSQSRYNRKR